MDVRPIDLRSGGIFLCQRWDTEREQWLAQAHSEDFAGMLASLTRPVLAVAIEWLDDLPATIAERRTGSLPTSCGSPAQLSDAEHRWLDRWWPQPGRAVVGRSRDRAWAWLAQRLPAGSVLLTVDYGHTRESRPPDGGLAAYHRGQHVAPGPDVNITAAVAVDSVAETVESLGAERLLLTRLADVPDDFWPTHDPQPLRRAALKSQEQLLRDPARFGGFWLVAHRIGQASTHNDARG